MALQKIFEGERWKIDGEEEHKKVLKNFNLLSKTSELTKQKTHGELFNFLPFQFHQLNLLFLHKFPLSLCIISPLRSHILAIYLQPFRASFENKYYLKQQTVILNRF